MKHLGPALLACLPLVVASNASAGTIVVDPSGGGDYTTIGDAVANAVSGDLILVSSGTYVEEVVVDVDVAIVGAGVGQTIVRPATSAPGSGPGSQLGSTTWMFRVRASDVVIASLTVDGNNPALGPGIDARGGIITDFTAGTFDRLQVTNAQVENVAYRGIYAAAGGTGHEFSFNTVRNVKREPLDSVGIFFFGAVGQAHDNTVDDCSVGLGFQAGGGGAFVANQVSNCDLGLLANGSTSPVSITGNTIRTSTQGIQSIAVSTTVDVSSNTTLGCATGLSLFGLGTGSNTVDGNTFDGQGLAGGSGLFATTDVTPFGHGALSVVATRNVLRDNDFGVTLLEDPLDQSPALACTLSGAAGLFNTFDGSLSFHVYLQDCDDDVDATHNAWGAVSPSLIEALLWHQPDDPLLGLIDFSSTVNLRLTVDDDGPADFTTINPAVQALLPGGTIEVRPGLYVEDVVVDRSCRIEGAGTSADPTIGSVLRGASIHPDLTVVSVTASDVHLENLRVDGQQPVYTQARRAIYASGVADLEVTDCVIHTATTGIAYSTSTGGLFLRNELFDFGVNLQQGGGIFLWAASGTVGTPGNGNRAHDGRATGFIFHNGSSGTALGNRARGVPLGYLSNGANAPTLFQDNQARKCGQGFQGIGNHAAVTYEGNTAFECTTGFTLFGLGAQPHAYRKNLVRGDGMTSGSSGLFFTTESVFGDDDVVATVTGNVITSTGVGVVLDETPSSSAFLMNASLDGSADANWIAANVSQDVLLQGCDDDIDATDNYFGSTVPGVVEGNITHQPDDPSLGLVDFSGLLAPGPDLRAHGSFAVGHTLAVSFTGTAGQLAVPFYSGAPAFIPTAFGTLLVDPVGLTIIQVGVLPAGGLGTAEGVVFGTVAPGSAAYFQSLTGLPGSFALSTSAARTAP